ncbi:MAG: trypsin-like peptidase domain-containing protein [Ignavibacteria bacterium]|nr:trypsin-like peptidase domain-containing protein [Ignavibacteria bacterium]MCC7159450.1 trypsin-like peptidase domain-containing protein [Ignavibacteria bacterium]
MNKSKYLFYSVIFAVVLASGFVFGHFVFKNESGSQVNAEENSVNRERVLQNITDSRENAITRTVKDVSQAVVGISVTEVREYRDPFGDDPFFRQFFGDRSYKQEVQGLGSGFLISDDGYIITNDHVVGNATKVVVSMTNGDHLDAEIIGKDSYSDIAVLKINKSGLPYIKLGNSDDVMIGEWVVALGNPFGLFEVNQKPTVTVGVVSASGMKLNSGESRFYRNMIQTDAAINSGNSGGPLVNSIGEIIGMNTLIYTGNSMAGGNIGLGFAIPINKVKKIVDELKKNGKIERNYDIGLRLQTVDKNIAQYFKLNNVQGAIVVSVENGSAAGKEGIKAEDIILSVNGEKIGSDSDFWGIITDMNLGDKIKLKILRSGDEIEKEFELKVK